MKKILDNYTTDEIEEILNKSDSLRDFLKKIGLSSNGTSAYNSIKTQLSNLDIEIPKFEYKNSRNGNNLPKAKTNEEIFTINSSYKREHLKNRIIKNNLLEYICIKCGNNGNWMNEEIILQLEHINGINNDNRLENLCFLCPNCHSQTKTYAGKKLKKK
jgi:5-methylcytosine-specific restriction endonuclease McrA